MLTHVQDGSTPLYIASEKEVVVGRCRDGVIINDFLFRFRHLLAPFLLHDVSSLLTLFSR